MSWRPGPTATRRLLLEMWRAGLAAVDPRRVVSDYLRRQSPAFTVDWVLAAGKAADGMLLGVYDTLPAPRHGALAVATGDPASDCQLPPGVTRLTGDHPLAGEASLAAARTVLAAIDRLPPQAGVLVLLSGGASALLELPAPGWNLDELRRVQAELLAAGLAIADWNAIRGRLSQLKHGGLARRLGERPGAVLLISDVPGDDPAVIGSGPLWDGPQASVPTPLPVDLPHPLPPAVSVPAPHFPHHVLASNGDFLAAAAQAAQARGVPTGPAGGALTGDAAAAGRQLARILREARTGAYLWGGETTVRLPAAPGRGGRNQALALAAAMELQDVPGISVLAAGTDGIDGNTEDAGALVDGATVERIRLAGMDPAAALAAADAGSALAAAGDVLHTGPTGSNVMDVVLAIKNEEDLA